MRRLSVVAVVLLAAASVGAEGEGEIVQEGVWSLYTEALVDWTDGGVRLLGESSIYR